MHEIMIPTILVVDDSPDNLSLMSGLLQDRYRVKVANSGERALAIVAASPPDLILLDVMMPGLDGYEVCRRLKSDPLSRSIPVIFLTAMCTVEDEQFGFELGAVDYIVKPISPPIVLARVRTHLELKSAADFLRNQNEFLENEVERRTVELSTIQNVTIQVVTSLAEARDLETGNHIRRTQNYVKALAEKLAERAFCDERYGCILTPQFIATIFKSAPLHDIGKVGVPDRILLKPGLLTPEEFEVMKTHTMIGYESIAQAEKQLGIEVDFLRTAKQIALSHHERWDGGGYPQGLRGLEIPLAARLMALADVYDALVSRRVYKEAVSHDAAIDILRKGGGAQFDPEALEAFLSIEEKVRSISCAYWDAEGEIGEKKHFLYQAD